MKSFILSLVSFNSVYTHDSEDRFPFLLHSDKFVDAPIVHDAKADVITSDIKEMMAGNTFDKIVVFTAPGFCNKSLLALGDDVVDQI